MSTEVDVNIKVTGAKKGAEDMDELGDSISDATSNVEQLEAAADNMAGGLISGLKGGVKGLQNMVRGMSLLKGAIIATGVGALVVALGSLVSWMRNTEKGAKAMKTASIALDIVWKDITDSINTATGALFENDEQAQSWIDGAIEWTARLSNMGQIYDYLNPKIEKASEIAAAMVKVQYALVEATKEFTTRNAELNQEIEVHQKTIDDTTKSYEERKLAVEEQNKATLELGNRTKELAALELQTLNNMLDLELPEEKKIELRQEIAQATAALTDAETRLMVIQKDNEQKSREIDLENEERKKGIFNTLAGLRMESITDERKLVEEEFKVRKKQLDEELTLLRATDEEKKLAFARLAKAKKTALEVVAENEKLLAQEAKDDAQALIDEATAREKEFISMKQTDRENEVTKLQEHFARMLELAKEFGMSEEEVKTRQQNAMDKLEAKWDKEDLDRKKQNDADSQAITENDVQVRQTAIQQKMAMAQSMANFLSALNDSSDKKDEASQRKAFNRGKALQLAGAAMSTASAIISALAAPPVGLGPVAGIPSAIMAGLAGAAQAISISRQKFDSGSPSRASSSSVSSPSVDSSDMIEALVPTSFADSATAPTTGSSAGIAPVQAFVVSSSITNQQQLDATISHQSSL